MGLCGTQSGLAFVPSAFCVRFGTICRRPFGLLSHSANSIFKLFNLPRMNGLEVTTIEKLGDTEKPHEIQKAFVKHSASQCGSLPKNGKHVV